MQHVNNALFTMKTPLFALFSFFLVLSLAVNDVGEERKRKKSKVSLSILYIFSVLLSVDATTSYVRPVLLSGQWVERFRQSDEDCCIRFGSIISLTRLFSALIFNF